MIKYYPDLEQGSDEWLAARCGLLTASEMKLIITPTLKSASNDKERAHLYELLAQRVTRFVEPVYISSDMLRGTEDEIEARALYAANYEAVDEMGFITNDKWGFLIGYSPDGLVGSDGTVEFKSRRQKYQIETIANNMLPDEYLIQIQTGLLVSERQWCDFGSYCGGLPMFTLRVFEEPVIQNAIVAAARAFELRLASKLVDYQDQLASGARLIPTVRKEYVEMFA